MLPPSSGRTTGASPCGDSRSVLRSSTTAIGRRYQARRPSPAPMAIAPNTRSTVQRSRTRGRSSHPAQPSEPAQCAEQQELLRRDRGNPGPAGRDGVGRGHEAERLADLGIPGRQPGGLEPCRRGSSRRAEPVVGSAEIVPVRRHRRRGLGAPGKAFGCRAEGALLVQRLRRRSLRLELGTAREDRQEHHAGAHAPAAQGSAEPLHQLLHLPGERGIACQPGGGTVAPRQEPLPGGGDAARQLGVGARGAHGRGQAGAAPAVGIGHQRADQSVQLLLRRRKIGPARRGHAPPREGEPPPQRERGGREDQHEEPHPVRYPVRQTPVERRGVAVEQGRRERGRRRQLTAARHRHRRGRQRHAEVSVRREVEVLVVHRGQDHRPRRVGHREVAEGLHPADEAVGAGHPLVHPVGVGANRGGPGEHRRGPERGIAGARERQLHRDRLPDPGRCGCDPPLQPAAPSRSRR